MGFFDRLKQLFKKSPKPHPLILKWLQKVAQQIHEGDLQHFHSKEQEKSYLETAKDTLFKMVDKNEILPITGWGMLFLIHFARDTATRLGEILHIEVENIRWNTPVQGYTTIYLQGKGGIWWNKITLKETTAILKEYLLERESEYKNARFLFPKEIFNKELINGLFGEINKEWWKKYHTPLGDPRILSDIPVSINTSFFRHNFAFRGVMEGIPFPIVSWLGGWTSSLFDSDLILSDEILKEALKQLEGE